MTPTMFRGPIRRSLRLILCVAMCLAVAAALGACYPNPEPVGLTPIPSLAPGVELTPVSAVAAQPTPEGAATPAGTTEPAATAPADAAATIAPTRSAGAAAASGGNVQAGQTVFAANCVACHGQNGQGGGIGPKLAQSDFVKPANQTGVHDVIANGRPGTAMPAWAQAKGGPLSDTQINDVVAYLFSLQK